MKVLAVITIVMSIPDHYFQCLRYERKCFGNAVFKDTVGIFDHYHSLHCGKYHCGGISFQEEIFLI